MGCDDELGLAGDFQVMDDLQEGQLSLGRKRCFRFVDEVESLLETIVEQRQEGFAMGLGMERLAAVRPEVGDAVQIGGEVKKTFGPHEEAVACLRKPGQAQRLGQLRAVGEGLSIVISVTTLGAEPANLGHCFEQSGFAASVVAYEECDVRGERDVDSLAKRWH